MTTRLEKIQPPIAVPIQSPNDGNSALSSSLNDHEAVVSAPTGSREPDAQRSALRKEELRFQRGGDEKRPEALPGKKPPSTSEIWKLLFGIQTLLRPEEEPDGTRKRGPAVCGCGFASTANDNVSVHVKRVGGTPKAYVTGNYKCGSPWTCPVCSKRAATERQERVQRVVEAVLARGGCFPHVVITIRHKKGQALSELKAAVSQSSRAARQGSAWNAIKKKTRTAGVLSAPEVTYSTRTGWHFHLHQALPMLIEDEDAARAGCTAYIERYIVELKKRGFDATWRGQFVAISKDAASAAAYVGKGIAWEISAGAATKSARTADSLGPFEIARRAIDGNEKMRSLWAEFAENMQGTRSCVITAAMSKALGIDQIDDEADAETQAEDEVEDLDLVGTLPTINWNEILRKGNAPTLFDKLESSTPADWPSIRAWAMGLTKFNMDDIPVHPDDLKLSASYVPPPPTRLEVVRTIAWRARTHMNGLRSIEAEIERSQQEYKKYRNVDKPISLGEVAACLGDTENDKRCSESGVSRALENLRFPATLSSENKVEGYESSQPCFE